MISYQMNLVRRLKQRFNRLTIFNRVLLGNSIVIIIGAIGGTILTRHFSTLGNARLMLLFATLGIALSLLVNYWIIKTALQPLHELRIILNQMKEGQVVQPERWSARAIVQTTDPFFMDLINLINTTMKNLEQRTTQLRALTERSINIQEEERKRIARGLHDDTAQAISSLIINLEQLENQIPDEQEALRSQIARQRQLANQILEDLRKNIWDLRPSILDDLGLAPAVRWYARSKLEAAGVQVAFDIRSKSLRLDHAMETMLFRIVQESINNVLRHAEARHVIIRLWQESDHVCLQIEDDGRGFDVAQTQGQALSKKQFGLLGIQERASLVGGQVSIQSSPGEGTHLKVCVPLLEESQPEGEAVFAPATAPDVQPAVGNQPDQPPDHTAST